MTKASFCLLGTLPPGGSAVRVKSRFRRYSANCESAFGRDLIGVDFFFVLVRLLVAADFLSIDQDFLLCATRFACRESARCDAADLPSRLRRLVIALLRLLDGRLGFRFPWPPA